MAVVRLAFSPLVSVVGSMGAGATEQVSARFDFDEIAREQPRPQGEPCLPDATLHHGRAFLQQLPTTLPVPQVSRDDTDLWFEWVGAGARMLSVRIGPDGILQYSGRLGARRRISGSEALEGDLSPLLLQAIEQVIGA